LSVEIISLILICSLIVLILIGTEVATSFALISCIGLFFLLHHPFMQFGFEIWKTVYAPEFIAAPLFILMGSILANSNITPNFFDPINKWFGRLPGGLASSVMIACAGFGAMSGSSVASAATFAKVVLPESERQGYDNQLMVGTIAVGGTLAVLIPPSLIMIVYGAWQGVSIAKLFSAGVIPGVILTLMYLTYIVMRCRINPKLAPAPASSTWHEKVVALKQLIPWFLFVILVLGTLFAGILTANESAALGVVLSICLAAFYRKMNFAVLKSSYLDTIKITAAILFIVAMAKTLVFIFQSLGITQIISSGIINLGLGKYATLTMFYLLYLVLGCLVDSISMLLLTLPFVMPVIISLGISPLWFGIAFIVLGEIGTVTPPFGMNLFTVNRVAPKYSILMISKSCLPFIGVSLIFLVIITIFPALVLWLPGILF
jgi:C4-dicarboxylate transporter DctM subunit